MVVKRRFLLHGHISLLDRKLAGKLPRALKIYINIYIHITYRHICLMLHQGSNPGKLVGSVLFK